MRSITLTFVAFLMMIGLPGRAEAVKINENIELFGYGQLWLALAEDAVQGEKVTDGEGNAGETVAFGFKDKRLRFGVKGGFDTLDSYYYLLFDGAGGTVKTKDYWFGLRPTEKLYVQAGRFRPFVTYAHVLHSSTVYENLEESKGLEQINAAYYLTNSSFRDMGLLIGYGDVKKDRVALLFSVTNGVGADGSVGGDVSAGTVYASGVGEGAYSLGLVARPAEGLLLHAAWSSNHHSGAVAKGGEVAITIDRTVASAGLRYALLDGDLWIDGEYARLITGGADSTYHGATERAWFVRAGWFPIHKTVELVARYELADDEGIVKGVKGAAYTTTQITVGVNWYLGTRIKMQLEYLTRERDANDPTLKSLRSCLQLTF